MLVVESTGMELPVGVDSTKKLYVVSGARPVKVKECDVTLVGLQHFDQVGFAVPMKYATCVSAGWLVVQVIVTVLAVTFVASTFEMEKPPEV